MAESSAPPNPWGVLGSATDPWFFCIRLLGERYAFDAHLALEVVRLGPLTRLPAAPAFLPGVFTHRGEVLPVLDVGQLVGERATSLTGRAVIVQCGPWRVALVADAVEGLVQVPDDRLEPPPATGGSAEFLAKVGTDAKGSLAILDLERMVESARARSHAA